MQPWQATLLACFLGVLTGALSSFIGLRILQTRHDEKIRNLEKEQRRSSRNIHDLREEVRNTLVRYLEDRIEDSKTKHVVGTLKTRFRRPPPPVHEDDDEDDKADDS